MMDDTSPPNYILKPTLQNKFFPRGFIRYKSDLLKEKEDKYMKRLFNFKINT